MRIAAAGLLLAAGLVVASLLVTFCPHSVFAIDHGSSSPVRGSSQLVTLVTSLSDNRQQLMVIDPELHVLSVYHIDAAGEVVLKSVRNFHWDLQMEQFNGTSPLPREIRSLLEHR